MDEAMGVGGQENCYEIYYMKEDALKLLLAGLGQTQWYGLFSGDGRKGAANRILAELYQNGMIDWEGDGAALRAPYAKMLAVMLEKKSCVTIQPPTLSAPVRCCYLAAADVVMTQKSQREDGTLGIALLPLRGFIGLVEAECARLEAGECCMLSCRSSQTGQAVQKLGISRDGLRAYRLEVKTAGGFHTRLRCMQEELPGRLLKLLYEAGTGSTRKEPGGKQR